MNQSFCYLSYPHSPISRSALCRSVCMLVTNMALHVVQAQHSSSVVVVAAFVVLLPATAQLVLDHLKKKKREHMKDLHIRTHQVLQVHNSKSYKLSENKGYMLLRERASA